MYPEGFVAALGSTTYYFVVCLRTTNLPNMAGLGEQACVLSQSPSGFSINELDQCFPDRGQDLPV